MAGALVKSSALDREYGAIWDTTQYFLSAQYDHIHHTDDKGKDNEVKERMAKTSHWLSETAGTTMHIVQYFCSIITAR